MSICPTCGKWAPEPVPDGLEDSIKPCRTCASRQRSGDAELVESAGKYHVRCYGCHLSTGDYNDPREAVDEWNALWEGVEEGEKLRGLVNRLLPLAMAAGAQSPKLKPIADTCFKEATELLGNIVEVKDEQ